MSDQTAAANAVAISLAGGQVAEDSVGVSAPQPEGKREMPWIRLPSEGYALSNTAKEIGAVLKTNGVFRREQMIVTINRKSGSFEEMSSQRLRTYVEKYMLVGKFKYAEGSDKPERKVLTMSPEVARGVIESDHFRDQQRDLMRVNNVPMPVLRADQRIELLQSGYDPESRVYTMPSEIKVSPEMSLPAAVALLRDIHKEFPFGDRKEDGTSRSLAVSIAAMLSLYGIGLLGPMTSRLHFVYTANAPRSGKSLLAKLAVVPTCGPANVRTKPESSEEIRKELASAVLNGASYVFFDDLDGMLRSQELNAFMTSATWGGRLLGSLTEFSVPKQCVVLITGNNLALSTDIANRTLRCSLYTEEFDAQARVISRTIDEEWLCRSDVRSDILSALWTLIREWDKAGRPKGPRTLRGFERWCEVFGGIVSFAGFGDPCEAPPQDDFSGDTEVADMKTLVDVLVDDLGTEKRKEFTFQELIEACQANDCFQWMMEGNMKKDKENDKEWLELNQRSKSALGKMFAAKFGGRKFRLKDGRVIMFGQRGRNRHRRYAVELLES